MENCKVIAIVNQKGGVGKTTTCANLGIGLARCGAKVLLIDADAQGSLTASLGFVQPDELKKTLATVMDKIMNEDLVTDNEGILPHDEGTEPNVVHVDLLPGNIELAGVEVTLVNAMSRENILRQYVNQVRNNYDYILIDCMPSLGMLTVNALTAADSVMIPVQPQYLPIKGLEQLLKTIFKVKKRLNPELRVEGILLTMVDIRTNFSKDIIQLLNTTYGERLRIFKSSIPFSVRASETSAEGKSIYVHDPHGKVSKAYELLSREVLGL